MSTLPKAKAARAATKMLVLASLASIMLFVPVLQASPVAMEGHSDILQNEETLLLQSVQTAKLANRDDDVEVVAAAAENDHTNDKDAAPVRTKCSTSLTTTTKTVTTRTTVTMTTTLRVPVCRYPVAPKTTSGK